MVRRLRKRKSCWHVIAIPQASIAAPTLTVMQGFEEKKDCSVYIFSLFLILHILPFHAIATPVRIEREYDGWKLSTTTTTLCFLQQCSDKMSYLNQMHEKKAIQGSALMRLPTLLLHD